MYCGTSGGEDSLAHGAVYADYCKRKSCIDEKIKNNNISVSITHFFIKDLKHSGTGFTGISIACRLSVMCLQRLYKSAFCLE